MSQVDEFKLITGTDDDHKVQQLLLRFNNNLNNALSFYFDNGFDNLLVDVGLDNGLIDDLGGSGADLFGGSNRGVASESTYAESVNLQSELFLQDLIPKLPRARKIKNLWRLNIGINPTPPSNSLFWFIILFLPKTLFSFILSFFKTSNKFRFNRSFNWLHYDDTYKFSLKRVEGTEKSDSICPQIDEKNDSTGSQIDEKGDLELDEKTSEKDSSLVTSSLSSSSNISSYSSFSAINESDSIHSSIESIRSIRTQRLSNSGTSTSIEHETARLRKNLKKDEEKEVNSTSNDSTKIDINSTTDDLTKSEKSTYSEKLNNEEYPIISEPDFFEVYNIQTTNFNESFDHAQKQYLWLITILIDDSEECLAWLKSLLSNTIFQANYSKEGVYNQNIIFINNVDKSPESHEIGLEYRVRRLPYVMITSNVSNNPGLLPTMSVLYKSNLILGEDYNYINRKILKNFDKIFDLYDSQLVSSRYDLKELEFSRMMVQQQNSAYEESLNQDREKKIIKEKQKQHEELIKLKNQYLSDLKLDIGGNTRIAIKLPNGKRIIENFDESVNLRVLYLYIEAKIKQEEENEEEKEDEEEEIENSKESITQEFYFENFPFNFDLVQPFPKKVIECEDVAISEVSELKSGANLFVEYKDE